MPLTKHYSWLAAAIVASIAGMVTGITQDLSKFSWIASILFGVALVATAVDMNQQWWRGGPAAAGSDAQVQAAVMNSRLVALGYLWGALALLFMYRMTGLRWQHGLQYGAGMALIAWLFQLYVHFLARPSSRLRSPRSLMQATWFAIAHGGAALGGVLFLVLSGKIYSVRNDWAANQVFLTGGLALVALSLVSAYTQFKLARPQADGVRPAGAGQA
jgi:hypothetical protein